MSNKSPNVVFLTDLPSDIVNVITSHAPEGFNTTVLAASGSMNDQIDAVQNADFLLIGTDLSDAVLKAAQNVRLVQLMAAGYDSINMDLMRELKVPCANNGGANAWAVADHAVLLMLTLYKQLLAANQSTREGHWNKPIDGFNTFEMAGKLVGILGIGNIGRLVARRVLGFDSKVQYYDKYPLSEKQESELGVSRVSLEKLFSTSDIITCHTPLTKTTHHIINAGRLKTMKKTATVINTSRGSVIDESALIKALQKGVIAGAGIDVFEKEPVDPDNPLLKMNNVIVTPHMAGTTWDTWFRRGRFAYDNMKRVWNDKPPLALAPDYQD